MPLNVFQDCFYANCHDFRDKKTNKQTKKQQPDIDSSKNNNEKKKKIGSKIHIT